MATQWQRFEIAIDPAYTDEERRAIAENICDYIRERTKEGKGIVKSGASSLASRTTEFAGYSKAYEKSLNFKIAGKSKGDVNMTQSGDMLGALDYLEDKSKTGKLVIGYENGSLENAIADGNIRGTYGQSKPTGPKRDFLGLTKRELQSILKQFPIEDQSSRRDTVAIERMTAAGMDAVMPKGLDSPAIPTFHGDGE